VQVGDNGASVNAVFCRCSRLVTGPLNLGEQRDRGRPAVKLNVVGMAVDSGDFVTGALSWPGADCGNAVNVSCVSQATVARVVDMVACGWILVDMGRVVVGQVGLLLPMNCRQLPNEAFEMSDVSATRSARLNVHRSHRHTLA
jgi:hypothetical protein